MKFIPLSLAKITKEHGFDEQCIKAHCSFRRYAANYEEYDVNLNSFRNSELDEYKYDVTIPTWHQLIEWIFNKLVQPDNIVFLQDNAPWLESWYTTLIEHKCPLMGEFNDRLLNIFRKNYLNINIAHSTYSQTYHYSVTGKFNAKTDGILIYERFTKQEDHYIALNKAIKAVFKLIEEKYEKHTD